MTRTNLTLAAAVALGLLSAMPAHATEHTGWIYNGLTGIGSVSEDGLKDSGLSSNSNIGYRWGPIGVELGHTFFSTFKDETVNGTLTTDTRARFKGWNAGVNLNHDLSDKWSVQARAGAFAWHVEGSVDDNVLTAVKFDDKGSNWYAGAAIDYTWRKRSSIGLGYTHYKAGSTDLDLWGLHSEFRF